MQLHHCIRHAMNSQHRVALTIENMCQEGTGSVRFVSVPDFSNNHRFGSVRFGQLFVPVRRGLACIFRTGRGSVWFSSVCFRVRFWPVPEFDGSVRFGRFGSVSYSYLMCSPCATGHADLHLPVSQRGGREGVCRPYGCDRGVVHGE